MLLVVKKVKIIIIHAKLIAYIWKTTFYEATTFLKVVTRKFVTLKEQTTKLFWGTLNTVGQTSRRSMSHSVTYQDTDNVPFICFMSDYHVDK